MIANVYICPNYNTLEKDEKVILKTVDKENQFRFIFEVNLKLVDVDLLKQYFKIFDTNKQITKKLVETCIVLNGSNPVKTSILKTFLSMVKKERPVRIIQ